MCVLLPRRGSLKPNIFEKIAKKVLEANFVHAIWHFLSLGISHIWIGMSQKNPKIRFFDIFTLIQIFWPPTVRNQQQIQTNPLVCHFNLTWATNSYNLWDLKIYSLVFVTFQNQKMPKNGIFGPFFSFSGLNCPKTRVMPNISVYVHQQNQKVLQLKEVWKIYTR